MSQYRRQSYWEGFKLYLFSCIGHHLQGMAVGIGLFSAKQPWLVMGLTWALFYIAYQGLTVIRKRDSAGLDVLDFMSGMAIGFVVYAIGTVLL